MVIRRKLFAYTLVFTAGISAGFFIYEKTRLAGGSLMMASAGAVICYAAGQDAALRRKLLAWLAAGFVLFTCRYIYYGTAFAPHVESAPEANHRYSVEVEYAAYQSEQADTINSHQSEQADTISSPESEKADTINSHQSEQADTISSHQSEKEYITNSHQDEIAIDDVVVIEGFADSVAMSDGKLKVTLRETDAARKRIGVLVTMRDPDGYDPAEIIGRRIRAYGKMREAPSADNPGCFDYRIYLRSKGIAYLFTARNLDLCDHDQSDPVSYADHMSSDKLTVLREDNKSSLHVGNKSSLREGNKSSLREGNKSSLHVGNKSSLHVGNKSGLRREYKISLHGECKISLRGRYKKALYQAREGFLDLFDDPEVRAFIKGTVFGDKSDIDEDVREEFSINGTGHILAVSGLHTGFLYALLRLITGKKRNFTSAAVTIAALMLYGDMTMWSPSAMRAVTVLSVSLMSVYARRPFDLLSSVSAAALLILIKEPYQLFSTGFQLSFIALLGICFFTGPLEAFIGEWLAVPVAVQAAILPLTGYIFHRINVLSVFINIPVIFMASVLVPACMTALMISLAAGTVPHVMISAIEGITELVVRFNGLMTAGGFFSSRVSSGGLITGIWDAIASGWASVFGGTGAGVMAVAAAAAGGLIFLMYLVLFIVSSEWFRVKILRHDHRAAAGAFVCAVLLSLCACAASYNTFADDEVVFVSVGQGDCTHIRAGGKDVLIDGGGDIERDIGKDVLMPYLLSNGAERAELCLVTHLHTDHYLGIVQLSRVFPVGAVGIPSDYRKSVEEQRRTMDQMGVQPDVEDDASTTKYGDEHDGEGYFLPETIEYIEQGERILVTDEVFIEPIWPLRGSHGDVDIDDPNENNMVYIVNYNGTKIMVTGDLLEEDELDMIKYYRGTDVLDCDILKVAHHGSKSSSSEEFLDAVSPDIAVIQVGANNFYGHPHQQTLDRLEDRGIRVYRTDLNGAVGIDIRRKIHFTNQKTRSIPACKIDLKKGI